LFQLSVNKEVQQYKTNLDKWITLRQTELNQYQLDIQNELNDFQKEDAEYQSTVKKAIRQSELDQERLMLSANKTTDLNLQNEAQTLNASIALYKDKLEKYLGQLQSYSSEVQNASTKYNLDQQKYTAQINHYNIILQGAKKEFEDYLRGRI